MSYRSKARAADPHWTTARFPCKAACGTDVKKGDEPGEKVVLRTWSLTGRGGLREIQNGE